MNSKTCPFRIDPRWALLEHIGAPNDSKGIHFDLLLEDGPHCRAWRLDHLLTLDAPDQMAIPLPFHSSSWLNAFKGRNVSANRGWARSIKTGFYIGHLPTHHDGSISIYLYRTVLIGRLQIFNHSCSLKSILL